jgi:hypothetical protein
MEQTPACRHCGQPITLRLPVPAGRPRQDGYWQHLLTEAGGESDKDHDAVR